MKRGELITPTWQFGQFVPSASANLTMDHDMVVGGTPFSGWMVTAPWFGEEDLGQAATGDSHPKDWKPEVSVTEKVVEGSKHPNVEVVIESKPEI